MIKKKNGLLKRQKAHASAVLRLHGAAIINIDPDNKQGAISIKTGRPIEPGPQLARWLCDFSHRWAVYAAVFCRGADGATYVKGQAGRIPGEYMAEDLETVFDALLAGLLESCNPAHVIGTGWLAAPFDTWIDDNTAADLFESIGAWGQQGVFDYEQARKAHAAGAA